MFPSADITPKPLTFSSALLFRSFAILLNRNDDIINDRNDNNENSISTISLAFKIISGYEVVTFHSCISNLNYLATKMCY